MTRIYHFDKIRSGKQLRTSTAKDSEDG